MQRNRVARQIVAALPASRFEYLNPPRQQRRSGPTKGRKSSPLAVIGSALRATTQFMPPAALAFGVLLAFPTVAAYQDMTSLVSGLEGDQPRWTAIVEKSVAGSVHAAEMPFGKGDSESLSGAGLNTPGIGAVAFRAQKSAVPTTPDEARVNRAEKQGRVLRVVPVAPPKNFNAGSIFERTSMLRPTISGDPQMAFAKPEIAGKEIEIAAAFHATADKQPNPTVPSYLVDLVTNDRPDVLATAYAPPAPDYAKASPFETLLQGDDPTNGRYVPPLGPGDHSWMSQPLPPEVFSAKEQQCLATAIYFEARGESTRGQAAVAQVVLNRVRNPTYPNTICGVVYQNDHWKNRCQFSFACDGIKDRVLSPAHYRRAEEIAMAVTAGKIFIPEVGSSTHYYAQYVSPGWARAMNKMTQIGLHIFYRTKYGGWN